MNISSYIEGLDNSVRSELYNSPWTCQALFRALAPLAQQYVIRLLFLEQQVPQDATKNWAKHEFASQHEASMALLQKLSILQAVTDSRGQRGLGLHPTFKAKLRQALSGGGMQAQQVDELVFQDLPTAEETVTYAHKQWETLLQSLLDPAISPPELPAALRRKTEPLNVRQLMETAGLLSKDDRRLTAPGFRFLLLDTYSQLWSLLHMYISCAQQQSGTELASALSFLMQLGFRRVGQPYPFDALTPLEQRIAAHMAQLGLLHTFVAHHMGRAPYFCPTPLAASLCGGYVRGATAGVASGAAAGGGYIIVETNYRVYAYTSNATQGLILAVFCHTECQLPNLYVGTLTRESVQGALARGLSAQDLITFLQQHAHPQVAKRVPMVPEVVMDQLRLWESETQRARTSPAYLYEQFESVELFQRSLVYAREHNVLLWVHPKPSEHKMYVVSGEGHARVRDYIKTLKAQLGSQFGGGGGGGPSGAKGK